MAAKTEETIHSAMAAAFAEIEAATKDAENPAFKRGNVAIKYADLSAVIAAIKPPLIAHNLFFTQRSHPNPEGVEIETVLGHASGSEMSLGRLFVPANKRDAQGFGSALTYARRYALMTAFGVPAEDDDGNAATRSTNGNLREQLEESVRQTPRRDLPFPQGPAKNITDLKAKVREVWREIESTTGDDFDLDGLLGDNADLLNQLREALPGWWDGYMKDGTQYPGLSEVITKKEQEIAARPVDGDWRENPVLGG